MAYEVYLYRRTEGAGGWTLCGTTNRLGFHVDGLTKGTAYEFQLVDWDNNRLTTIGSTTANGVPLSDITALYDEAVARVAQLETDVAARDATIAERDTTIAAQQSTIDEQATSLTAAQATIAEQAAALAATPAPTPKPVTAGDYITFGHYPQTAEGKDNTPIEWLVLEVQGNKALVISRYGLDAQPYNTTDTSVTWQTCSLRKWLNGTFLNKAFTGAERLAILQTTVDNSSSQCYSSWSTSGGNDTSDKVFLLSYAEANIYLSVTQLDVNNVKSRASLTAYAITQGASQDYHYKTEDDLVCCRWWLRSPGLLSSRASCVYDYGGLYSSHVNDTQEAVRPAFWLNLDSAILKK